jgi:LacI family transcriptional regulator
MQAQWRTIWAQLQTSIADGSYGPGARLPSENQLARKHGVSRPTVARALRELEHSGLIERRRGSGSYVRAAPEDQHAARGGATFGLLTQGLSATEALAPIFTEITKICQARGATVLWGDADSPRDGVEELDRLLGYYLERRVDGVFFAPGESAPDREEHNVRVADTLAAAGIPIVLLDRDVVEFPGRSEFPLVGIDNFLAGFQLGQHLIDSGRSRLCFLARPHHPSTTDLRAAGCHVAAERATVKLAARWRWSADADDDRAIEKLLARDSPDAIICANDQTAAKLMQTLARMKVSVPGEVAVVGFDDVEYSTLLSVELTTMRQPFRALAAAAVDLMISGQGRQPDLAREIRLPARLIVRQSCGAEPA